MDKTKLHELHQQVFDGLKAMMPKAVFEKWYAWALYLSDYEPEQWKQKSDEYEPVRIISKPPMTQEQANRQQGLIEEARQAVSGYAPTNGARKAVEALADALEQAQAQ